MAQTEEHLAVNSIIGEGAEFNGDFKLSGLLRIDGIFRGTIKTDGKVLIGKNGIVDTDIRARIVVAGGEIHGNIFATERVTLLASCRMKGDIITPKVVMEEGVQFEGNCKINPIAR
ncbi:polymer-forming cytoskeletal family protein [Leptospira inadai serovar Lyme str. 10]|uniref:Polymer-forming cytoskeletal family protein n=2 Tax=Leptospira inadai serovar Lyme TaxID=293084 RepID=V6HQL5_9LEPT|nr:polymer-forming cytoskeletal protein [Leptospira inadai]EQA34724.1 polymer-forming cytoskeletal family protein [Leptospira inadai serovar Lyme str. 10]PNV75291.1 polymer-forming cytoskeletal protein [Leptospira inadai serovar Lyme]